MPDRHATAQLPSPSLDIADETFVRVSPEVLAPVVADSGSWIRWWPDLVPHVTRDRGVKGQQWAVTGALAGSMEIWLEPAGHGTVVHWYLRANPTRTLSRRSLRRERERRVRSWKRDMFALKDRLERVKNRPGPAEST